MIMASHLRTFDKVILFLILVNAVVLACDVSTSLEVLCPFRLRAHFAPLCIKQFAPHPYAWGGYMICSSPPIPGHPYQDQKKYLDIVALVCEALFTVEMLLKVHHGAMRPSCLHHGTMRYAGRTQEWPCLVLLPTSASP